jgi:hypothetical protein
MMERGTHPICGCCGGSRTVLTATGEQRPCSRCSDEFIKWASGVNYTAHVAAVVADRESDQRTK